MKRNKNIEFFRAFATMSVMFYHFYVVSGKKISGILLPKLLEMGGELGVTMFFVISGFGIFLLLETKQYNYKQYLTSRFKKLVPQYYVNIFILILFSQSAVYLSPVHFPNILSHYVFLHSLVPDWHGSINGVLWTMGVMFQFYLLSFLLHKVQKKRPIILLFLCIFSILAKVIVYRFILPGSSYDSDIYYFIFGRQIYTSIDNFIIGMWIAKLAYTANRSSGHNLKYWLIFIICLFSIVAWAIIGHDLGVYRATVISYIYHPVCALLVGGMLYAAFMLPEYSGRFFQPIFWIAQNSYGIYLWHLEAVRNILHYSEWIQGMNFFSLALLCFILSCGIGRLSTLFGKAFEQKKCNLLHP